MRTRPDVVVVGAGIVGVLVAGFLAERGRSVIVLERKSIASGASGGPGKRGIRSGRRDPRELPFIAASHPLWTELGRQTGASIVERIGGLTISNKPLDGSEGGPDLGVEAEILRRHNIDAELLERDRLWELEAELGPEAHGALLVSADGVARHEDVTVSMAELARRHGAEIREGQGVVSIGENGDVITADGDRISPAEALVLTANISIQGLLEPLIGRLPLWAAAPQMNFVKPERELRIVHLVNHANRPVAIKSVDDGLVMISGGSRGRWDNGTGSGQPILSVAESALLHAAEVVPGLRGAIIQGADASRADSWSLDGVPIIDRYGSSVPLYFAAGWSGHGFASAPAAAAAIAEWITSGQRPTSLIPFSLDRFSAPKGNRQ